MRALLFVSLLTSATALAEADSLTRAPAAPATRVSAEIVAHGLVHPWALQFLPDGRMLVTERPGRLRLVSRSGQISAPVQGVPEVAAAGQGGLLDVALTPDFATSARIAFTFAEPRGGEQSGTAVAVARLNLARETASLEDLRVIFRQEPASSNAHHYGSRIAFHPDGSMFIGLGERGHMERAQELTGHLGKVVRIKLDGSIPADNPFAAGTAYRREIWSYGHRNIQAAAIEPTSGKLWTIEHGPRGGDEVNIPLAGRNYGWPVIGYGIDYSGARIHQSTHRDGMEQPVYLWRPSIAPSGMAFYTGTLFPAWQGNLLVGALAGQALHRLVLRGETVVGEEVLLADRNWRIRDVRQGPDGAIWLLTDERNGKIVRMTPQ